MSADKSLYNEAQAAEYLGFSKDSIKTSRSTGVLAGVTPPKHVKIGTKSIRYRKVDLESWANENAKVSVKLSANVNSRALFETVAAASLKDELKKHPDLFAKAENGSYTNERIEFIFIGWEMAVITGNSQ